MRIFVEVPLRGASNDSGLVVRTGDFSVIFVAISSERLELKLISLCAVIKCLIDFPVTLKCLPTNDLEMLCFAQIFIIGLLDFSAWLSEATTIKTLLFCQRQKCLPVYHGL